VYGTKTIKLLVDDTITITASALQSVAKNLVQNKVSIFPNPGDGSCFLVKADNFNGEFNSVEVMNTLGSRIETTVVVQQSSEGYQVNLGKKLNQGAYFIKVNLSNSTSAILKYLVH
jgi:methionine-rich copper-binding protein CopC